MIVLLSSSCRVVWSRTRIVITMVAVIWSKVWYYPLLIESLFHFLAILSRWMHCDRVLLDCFCKRNEARECGNGAGSTHQTEWSIIFILKLFLLCKYFDATFWVSIKRHHSMPLKGQIKYTHIFRCLTLSKVRFKALKSDGVKQNQGTKSSVPKECLSPKSGFPLVWDSMQTYLVLHISI